MANPLKSRLTGPKSPNLKRLVIGLCSAIVLCIVSVVGVWAFALWGGGGEPATLLVATQMTREFVQAIHDQKIDVAHSMLSENFSPKISKEQLAALIEQDEEIFNTYQELDICEWGFYVSNGRVITTTGLLYYENGVIVVEISLHKDADAVWRVQGFRFRSDITPTPFGLYT